MEAAMNLSFLLSMALAAALPLTAQKTKVSKPLGITAVAISQFEDGPNVPNDFVFDPGETVFVRFQIEGFKAPPEDEPGKIQLSYILDAKDPAGIPIVETKSGKVEVELAPQDKEWLPKVRHLAVVPSTAPSGEYKFSAIVRDGLAGGAEVKRDIGFRVRGRKVEPSESLVVRNFRFLRNEDDLAALAAPAYSAGSPVWARFEITGFKLGVKNAIDVEYGLAVFRENGQKLFEQPVAAGDREATFYPKRYVPGALSINLAHDIAKAPYTIELTARDKIGKQTVSTKHVFTVE
jgi:hypothetical protein